SDENMDAEDRQEATEASVATRPTLPQEATALADSSSEPSITPTSTASVEANVIEESMESSDTSEASPSDTVISENAVPSDEIDVFEEPLSSDDVEIISIEKPSANENQSTQDQSESANEFAPPTSPLILENLLSSASTPTIATTPFIIPTSKTRGMKRAHRDDDEREQAIKRLMLEEEQST
ncbi:hypothetical protein PENTCL1PPCAC_24290, partial [Pristionchus entomophagus]